MSCNGRTGHGTFKLKYNSNVWSKIDVLVSTLIFITSKWDMFALIEMSCLFVYLSFACNMPNQLNQNILRPSQDQWYWSTGQYKRIKGLVQ